MTDYTSTRVENYNDDPAPDNGTTVSGNQITWAGIKEEYFDPINTAIASLDAEADDSFADIIETSGTQSMFIDFRHFAGSIIQTESDGQDYEARYIQLANSPTNSDLYAAVVMPNVWDHGEIVVTPVIQRYDAGSGTGYVLELRTLLLDSGDAINGTFSSATSITDSLPNQGAVALPTFAAHDVGGDANDDAGKLLLIHIHRYHDDGSDNYNTGLGLMGAHITYQTTALIEEE